ncbi:uncharacterized protein LOC144134080 [Amblyomma americanum]
MSGTAARGLVEHINEALESSLLPKEWKDAEVRFIPMPGKALTIENMRPISITFCVGKVMIHMVLRRLQKHLEEADEIAGDDVRLQATSHHPRRVDPTPRIGLQVSNEARAAGYSPST